MRLNRTVSMVMAVLLLAGLGAVAPALLGQAPQQFKAQLRIVPIANANGRTNIDESPTVFATANVTGVLTGNKLAVNGTFEGFKAPASIAQIHQSVTLGVRGPVVFDLTVTKETKGTITGTFDLSPEQVNLLKSGRLYVQIHNQNTPEGALWGWFLK